MALISKSQSYSELSHKANGETLGSSRKFHVNFESKHKVPITLLFEVTQSLTSQSLQHVVAEGAGRMRARC